MSELEYAEVLGDVNRCVIENDLEMNLYPHLHRLFACLGYAGDQDADIIQEEQIVLELET